MLPDLVFYVPGHAWAIDFAIERNGQLVTQITGETLEQVRERHPKAEIASASEVQAQIEESGKTTPRLITQEDFDYALNVLPPNGWHRGWDGESFKMAEHTVGRITAIYARQGDTFWKFEGLYNLPHDEIMGMIEKARAALSEI